ncbi:unnamed protein product [Closterium sp. NIES-53]
MVKQLVDDEATDDKEVLSAGEDSTGSDVVEVPLEKPKLRRSGRARRLPERLSFHTCLPPAAFTTLLEDSAADGDLPEIDPDVHANPDHRDNDGEGGVDELERQGGEGRHGQGNPQPHRQQHLGAGRTPARCEHHEEPMGADDEMDYYDDGTGRVCKLLKSLFGLKRSLLLYYKALDDVLTGADKENSQVDEAQYFKVGDDGVTCWVLVYINDQLAASSSTTMLKEPKELLEAAFELCEISPIEKYLGLEIMRERPARKLWLHQQSYVDKMCKHFIDEVQTGWIPKTPVSVDAYAELKFDHEEAQEREEEEYRHKVGLLQFAATTTRPNIAFACIKFGSGRTVRSDLHWREVAHCLAHLADTRDRRLESLCLVSYTDADNTGVKKNCTSTSGYAFAFGGATVPWSSQRIKCAMFSSTESEYVAATEAGKEV